MNIVASYPNLTPLNLNVPTESAQHDAAVRQVVPAANQAFTSSNENEVGSQRERERNNETRYHGHDSSGESDVEDVTYSSIIHSRSGGKDRDHEGSGEGGDSQEERSREGSPGTAKKPNGEPLSEAEQAKVEELKARDKEVRTHEQQHKATGGQYASAPSYETEKGPDGKDYVVDGSVQISVSEESTPEKTIKKMQQVYAAALAPAEPSGADRQVAAEAKSIEAKARAELREDNSEDRGGARAGSVTGSAGSSAAREAAGADGTEGSSSQEHEVSGSMVKRNMTISRRYNSSWSPFRTSVSAYA